MKKISKILALLMLTFGLIASSEAQTVTVSVLWTNPTLATDNSPLTGLYALTKIQIFASSTPMKIGFSDPPLVPYMELVPVNGVMPTQMSYTPGVQPKQTIYFRGRACNINGCSVYSTEVNKYNPGTTAVPVTVTLTTAP